MYLDELARAIEQEVPPERLPEGDTGELFRSYAVLLRAKGTAITLSDVHDAWSAWIRGRGQSHDDLVPFEVLSEATKEQDRVYAEAIRRVAAKTGHGTGSQASFQEVLFPSGKPDKREGVADLLSLYKMMVDSSEALVTRRQGVNTFFLTINGALLTASGVIVQSASTARLAGIGILVLALAGALLSAAWRSLMISFGQLNRGKFKVINTIERHLPVAIYAAEWEALDRGNNKRVYRSFTEREIWVPNALIALHVLTALVALLYAIGILLPQPSGIRMFWFASAPLP